VLHERAGSRRCNRERSASLRTTCFDEPPRSAHCSRSARQHGVALHRYRLRQTFQHVPALRQAALSAVRVAFARWQAAFSTGRQGSATLHDRHPSTCFIASRSSAAGLSTACFTGSVPLHTSPFCASLHRVSVRSTQPSAGCFNERSLLCITCRFGRRIGRSRAVRRSAAGLPTSLRPASPVGRTRSGWLIRA
jgi:hypothetical protein